MNNDEDDLSDYEVEIYEGLALADYGPAQRVCCFSCKTASLIQSTGDLTPRFCPICGADSDGDDEPEDDEEH